MPSPTDDEAAGEPAGAPAGDTDDPTPSYPRGNRLGLGHPRPTVVIAVVLVLLLGGAYLWSALRPTVHEPLFCTMAGSIGSPTAATPEAAFEAWWREGGATSAQRMMARELGRPVAEPSPEDFEPLDDLDRMWRIDDAGVAVGVGRVDATTPDYRVIGVNPCGGDGGPSAHS